MVDSGDSSVTITVRLIRSFEHRNIKHVVYKKVPLHQTVEQFMRNVVTDTMKIQHKAYGAKSNDPVINTEDDEKLMLKPNCKLFDSGIENETEISFFKIADYRKYQADPVMKWY
ncbi:UPF0538 protein C2orf76 homolog isoform X2 [Acropora palmata]|uniref:UPF0538 protein C2orf76 homolog isoform X2 n=1 Tax=Acropora palmata TaxID=6131 RepID=UPI003DA00AAD